MAQPATWQEKEGEKLLQQGADALDFGISLRGLESLWYRTGDGRYFKLIQQKLDALVAAGGTLPAGDRHYQDLAGRNLLLVYKVLNKENYYKTATAFLQGTQTPLSGLAIEYGTLFHRPDLLDPALKQLAEDAANKGNLGLGTYGLELSDALENLPAGGARDTVSGLLRQYVTAALKQQDPRTGLWNYGADPKTGKKEPDAYTSCLNVYVLAHGVRKGWLPASALAAAKKGYAAILKAFVSTEKGFQSAAVLPATGSGAFLLASGEMEMLPDLAMGKGHTVLLDYFFNNEHKKDITGQYVRFHYTWEDQSNSGFSLFGDLFRQYGLRTDSLPVSPDADNLKAASIYIIVDPDNDKESPVPNYMTEERAAQIVNWVKGGGILILMSNDSANAEFKHFNLLPEKFGIHFNEDCRNKVNGNQFEMGALHMDGKEGVFKTARKVYIKELSTLKLSAPAQALYTDQGDVIMAVSRLGKGMVFAVGDPWFYNEYFDGRRLPASFQQFNAARDLIQWWIGQIPAGERGIRTPGAGLKK